MSSFMSHKLKLIFCHVPRTSGTSMTEFLRPHVGADYVQDPQFEKHQAMRTIKLGFPKEVEKYASLAMVRHPFDRFVSLHAGYSPKCTLDEMVYEIISGRLNLKKYAFYWSAQRWLCDINGNMLATHVFRLEDGIKPVVQLLNKLGASVKVEDYPHVNAGTADYKKQREACSDETMKGIEKIYSWDYDTFGYERGREFA